MAERINVSSKKITRYQNTQLDEQIKNLEDAEAEAKEIYDRQVSDLEFKADEEKKVIDRQLEDLNFQKQEISKVYEAKILALELAQEAMQKELESGAELSKTTVDSLMTALGNIEGLSYANRLTSLAEFVKDYNATLAQINALEVSPIQINPDQKQEPKAPQVPSKPNANTNTTVSGAIQPTKQVRASVSSNTASTVINNPVTYNGIKISTPNVNKVFTNFTRQTGSMEN
jgi:hypothetical protein